MYTPYSAYALGAPRPYNTPNWNFVWAAGPDGRDFLDNGLTPYYSDNPDQALIIYNDVPGLDKAVDPLFAATGVSVGFPAAGKTISSPSSYLFSFESQIGTFPGALEANFSFQALREYFYNQAEVYGVVFSEENRQLIDQGFDALIERYASILEDDNLMKTGSDLNGPGEGIDYVDAWTDIVGVESSDFYNVGSGFQALWDNLEANITSSDRFLAYSEIFAAAAKEGSTFLQFYTPDGPGIKGINPYASPAPQPDGNSIVGDPFVPTVFQSLLGDFKALLDSGAYSGEFADGGLKIESGIRSLLDVGLDANPLNTGQGYGYAGNGSPTAPLGLESQSILERIPGYELMAFNTYQTQYSSNKSLSPSTAAAAGDFNQDYVNGSGFFPEESPALSYDNFTWDNVIDTPTDQFVSQDLFPTPENESLEAIQFFKVEFTAAGLYLDMPDTPVSTHLILSPEDVSGDIDEEFSSVEGGPTIADLNFGLGEGFSNFAASSNGDDVVMGGDLSDFIITKDGNDKVMGMAGDDLIDPGAGYDVVISGAGSDTIFVRQESMKGKLGFLSYLTLPDFSSEDELALEEGIGYELIDDFRLKLTFDDHEKIIVLSGSSTLKEDESGMMRSEVGWEDIIANGQIVMV